MPNTHEQKFLNALRDIFIGARIEGESGFINLMRIKSRYYTEGVFPKLMEAVDEELVPFPNFREELFDKLYSFFKRYFSESGSIYFRHTPYYQDIYERIYTDDRDVMLFWKTQNLYYVKTDRLFRSLTLNLDDAPDQKYAFDASAVEKQSFNFDASGLQNKRNNEKRSLIFEYRGKLDDGTLKFAVNYMEGGKKTKTDDILKAIKRDGVAVGEDQLTRAFRLFERQSEVDFFINKNAKAFLEEQFDLWLYQYLFKRESDWTEKRVRELQALKRVARRIIEFISQFEDELVRIWNKPKFALRSNYVVTFDRVFARSEEVARKLLAHENIQAQVVEWRGLGIVDEQFTLESIFSKAEEAAPKVKKKRAKQTEALAFEADASAAESEAVEVSDVLPQLSAKFRYLPFDTKHFKSLELEILSLFDDLDEELDGRLIYSENYQALNTLKDKFQEKVKCIYIDPPFNLGDNADFLYLTDYHDSTWLSVLENRLKVSLEMLDKNGLYFIRCDYHGSHLVRQLIGFLGMTYRAEILVERSRNEAGSPNKLEATYEHLFMFSKVDTPLNKFTVKRSLANIKWTGFLMAGDRNPPERSFLGKVLFPPKGQHFSLIQDKVNKLLKEFYLRLKCKTEGCGALYYHASSTQDLVKIMKRKNERFKFYDITVDTNFHGLTNLEDCLDCGQDNFGVEYLGSSDVYVNDNWLDIPSYSRTWNFATENSEDLLQRVELFTDGMVMDYFSGSGTTVAVAQKLMKKWISIDQGTHFDEIELPRMKQVLFGEQSGISKELKWKGGGFFKYFALEQYEDTLRRASYLNDNDTEQPAFFDNPYESPFASYVFLRDKKMADALTVDYENNKINVDFSKLYPDIDLAETLSCVKGKFIKSLTAESVTFADGETVRFDELDYRDILPLVWWDK
jgi:adenine-specific DNA-methyltransferase